MPAKDQIPLDSPFEFSSTAQEVAAAADLADKTVLITGGSAGLGLELAKAAAGRGAKVVLPVRSPDKAKAALGETADKVEIAVMDLGDFDSVRRFASAFSETGRGLDIVINNAGIMACPLERTPQGYELQFATNHLGHMLMVKDLMPAVRRGAERSGGARVVALSSVGHRISPVEFEDIHFETREYHKWLAYGQSKTANALYAVGLDQRGKSDGIRAFSVHPGGIMTDLQRHLDEDEMRYLGWIKDDGSIREGFKTPAQGAATSLWAATSPLLEGKGGLYCEDCNVAALTDDPQAFSGVRDYAVDEDAAERLWSVSETMLAQV